MVDEEVVVVGIGGGLGRVVEVVNVVVVVVTTGEVGDPPTGQLIVVVPGLLGVFGCEAGNVVVGVAPGGVTVVTDALSFTS